MNSAVTALKSARVKDYHLDLMFLASKGRKFSFDKVIKMIDDMVGLLKTEQNDDKKKELERTEGELTAEMTDSKDSIAALADEIKSLSAGIVALDKTVAEATENRKEDNSDYKILFAADSAAKEILLALLLTHQRNTPRSPSRVAESLR